MPERCRLADRPCPRRPQFHAVNVGGASASGIRNLGIVDGRAGGKCRRNRSRHPRTSHQQKGGARSALAAGRKSIWLGSRKVSSGNLLESRLEFRRLEGWCDHPPLSCARLRRKALPLHDQFMILTLPYPNIDPVFLRVGPLQLRWYGLMYMLSFVIGYFVLRRFAKLRKLEQSNDDLYDLLFYLILGVMIGGRLGYVVFYDLGRYIREPLSILAIWQGGMSFHGGFIGMLLAALWITRRKGWNFWDIADLGSAVAPIGLGLGRIGNFINGELFGRPTNVAWAMVFPEGGSSPRHPSQIYEALIEGLVLFLILRWFYRRNFHRGTVFWAFVAFYGLFRFLAEFVREPDAQIGFDVGPFTRGQLLTAPMLVIGTTLMIIYARRSPQATTRPSSKSRAQ